MAGTNATIGGGGFHHVAIRARDFDRSVSFYTTVLGFQEKLAWGDPPKRAIMLDTGDGNYLEIFERPDQPRFPAFQGGTAAEPVLLHMAFRTSDCDQALERARAAGCPVTMEPRSLDLATRPTGPTAVRIAFCKGPDGESIEFFQNEAT